MNILIIDDNCEITTMLSKYFTLKGHMCHVSNDGKHGLHMMENSQFNVVLLDLAMPDFSGRDLIDHLHDHGKMRNHTVITLTASSLSDIDATYLMEKGVHSVLKKPIDPDTLLEYLMKVTAK